MVLVWRLDRWGGSVTDLLATLQEREHLGVGFVSLTEALDLTTPAGRAMAALLSVFAEFEREILTTSDWDGRHRRPYPPMRSGNYIALASAKLRSPAGSGSAAPPCAESWLIPPRNSSAHFLTQACRKLTLGGQSIMLK